MKEGVPLRLCYFGRFIFRLSLVLPLRVAFLGSFCVPFYIWSYLQNSRRSQMCQISLIECSFSSGDLIKSRAPTTDSHLCGEMDRKMVFLGLPPPPAPCLNLTAVANLLFYVCQNGAEREVIIHYSWHSLCAGSSTFSAWYGGTSSLPVVTDRWLSTGERVQSLKEVKKFHGCLVISSLALLFRVKKVSFLLGNLGTIRYYRQIH